MVTKSIVSAHETFILAFKILHMDVTNSKSRHCQQFVIHSIHINNTGLASQNQTVGRGHIGTWTGLGCFWEGYQLIFGECISHVSCLRISKFTADRRSTMRLRSSQLILPLCRMVLGSQSLPSVEMCSLRGRTLCRFAYDRASAFTERTFPHHFTGSKQIVRPLTKQSNSSVNGFGGCRTALVIHYFPSLHFSFWNGQYQPMNRGVYTRNGDIRTRKHVAGSCWPLQGSFISYSLHYLQRRSFRSLSKPIRFASTVLFYLKGYPNTTRSFSDVSWTATVFL